MTRVAYAFFGCVLIAAVADAQGPPQAPVTTAVALQRNYAQLKNNITASAEKMPEADYFFKPTADIRGYGQLWGHVADAQFGQCAGVVTARIGGYRELMTKVADIRREVHDVSMTSL